MTTQSIVAALYTRPETAIQDYQRLFELAEGVKALQPDTTTILKDNITWHFPMPGANTTPWQLEGTIVALRQAGFYWPLKYKGIAGRWRTQTAWGQLFQRYQQRGYLAD